MPALMFRMGTCKLMHCCGCNWIDLAGGYYDKQGETASLHQGLLASTFKINCLTDPGRWQHSNVLAVPQAHIHLDFGHNAVLSTATTCLISAPWTLGRV